jgi:formylglycine-generating enzyme required for sulfatase activity
VQRLIRPLAIVSLALAGGAAHAAVPAAADIQVFRDCPTCPEMVVVPAGTFVMGTPASTLERVEVRAETETSVIRIARPLALGRHEVTRGEFAEFIRESGHEIRPGCRTWDATLGRFNDDGRRTWSNPGVPAEPTDTHPVSCVAWADAQAYARWLSQKTQRRYRLPSEAEWEYAARAGTSSLRFWGDAPEDGCDFANTYDTAGRTAYRLGWANAGCADGFPDVAPVGQFRPNAFGLHDMIGNVWEWVEDCAAGSYVGRPKDGSAWTWLGGCKRRVMRGGGWITAPERSRSGFHGDGDDTDRADYSGFRVALDLDDRAGRGEGR